MNELLNWLFGLQGEVRFGAEGVEFGWARPIPAWAWALAAAGAAAAAGWSYSRIEAPVRARGVLATLRAFVLLLLIVMLAGPRLELERTSTERDWLYLLVDRSASMTIPDAPAPADIAARPGNGTREAQLRTTLERAGDTLASLAESKRTAWVGFDASAYDLPADDRGRMPALGEPSGRRTSINAALDTALRRAAAKPVSGIVLFSDGRADQRLARGVLNRLRAEQIPVFAVPLGADEPRPDWRVRTARAPSVVFADDVVPFEVTVERRGGAGAGAQAPPIVELVDTATDRVLDRAAVGPGGTALLDTTLSEPGERRLEVRLAEESARRDLIASNNNVQSTLRVVEGPIRVLYLDGAPRWEQRYLKSLLLREDSIASTSLILAPARRYQQDGDVRIGALPVSPEEWAEFDVVVIGDMQGGLLGAEQLEALKRHVADRGAGLLWLGGPTATPGAWRDTPLDDLLPMRVPAGGDPGASGLELIQSDVILRRTDAAERLGLLELGEAGEAASGEIWAGRVSDPATGWSRLRWAQRIEPDTLKPATRVFAEAVPVRGEEPTPLVLSMRFGAGRSVYVGTDEIWRWRYGRGETLNERFWLPLVRLLARERVERAARGAVLEVSPREPVAGSAATLSVRIFDQALLDAAPSSVRVRAEAPGGARETVRLEPAGADRPGRGSAEYTAAWFPNRPGVFSLAVDEPILAGMGLEAEVEVVAADDELREPATDHALLADLADRTGGAVLEPDELDRLPGLLPNRARVVIGAPGLATLWDTLPFLVGLVLLASGEWILRRLVKLT